MRLFGGIPIPCSYAEAVPRFSGTIQNKGATTKHPNDHSNMKKKIPSGSGDGGGRGKKNFEYICYLFL